MRALRNAVRRLLSGSTLLALAGVLGVATALAVVAYLSGVEGEADPGNESAADRSVVVMRENVPAGTELTAAMVEVQLVSIDQRLPGGFDSVDDVVGRTTRYPLLRNEQVVLSKLVGSETETGIGLAFSVPPGMRAISIPISQVSTAGGLIVPGDRVDVMVSTTYEKLLEPAQRRTLDVVNDGEQLGDPVVFTVLQDVLVLAIAQTITPPLEQDRDPATLRSETAEPNPGAGTATVAVTPEQAQLLFMATEQGSLGLALRPYGEDTVETLAPRFRLEPVYESITGLALQPRADQAEQ